MKKLLAIALFFGILFTSCKNESGKTEISDMDETTDVIVNSETDEDANIDLEKEPYELDYLYKSDNGEILAVTFFEENNNMHVKIKRTDKAELVLNQTTAWAKGAEYEKDNYKWVSQEDGATFSDGTNTMKLDVISPLQYTYSNDKESIIIIYFDKDDTRFVTILKDNQPEVTLEQTEAWAKGAEYGTDKIKWRNQGETGVLIEDGVESTFKQKL